jgi:putative transposase
MVLKRASYFVYNTRSYLVWTPKYRKWVLIGAIRHRVKALFQEIAGHHGFGVRNWRWTKEHVHLFVSFPSKYSIGQVVGLFKPVSAKKI